MIILGMGGYQVFSVLVQVSSKIGSLFLVVSTSVPISEKIPILKQLINKINKKLFK